MLLIGSRAASGILAFGEEKSLADWIRDHRCAVSRNTVFTRIRRGMSRHDALFTPLNRLSAFGETKSLHAWTKDARCRVGYTSLARRVRYMRPEEALTAPGRSNPTKSP